MKSTSTPLRHVDAEGSALLSIVMSIAVIGVIAAAVLLSVGGSPASTSGHTQVTTSRNQPLTPRAAPSAASVAACQSSYQAVQSAVDEFEYDTGTGATNMSQLQGFLHGSVSTPQYTISIDRSLAGEIDVATPGHPAAPGDGNCADAGP